MGQATSIPLPAEPDRPRRVFSLGLNSAAFPLPLYRDIRQRLPMVAFETLEYTGDTELAEARKQVYQRFHRVEPLRPDWFSLCRLASACLHVDLWRHVWWRLVLAEGPARSLKQEVSTATHIAYFKDSHRRVNRCDLYHFQFCEVSTLRLMDAVPDGAKVICSFWGSDLMRVHGLYDYHIQSRALERADVITVQSVEMRETLLAKFGRHLFPKVQIVLFPLDVRIASNIDKALAGPDAVAAIRRELAVPEGRILVAIGHNGDAYNNHLQVVAALSRHSPEEKACCVCVFPMTYGATPNHLRAVKTAAAEAGLDFRLLTRFLDWAELGAFRAATDILIHVPASDAVSGTLLEVVYAGNVVITGGWLPYSPFRLADVPFLSANDFDGLLGVFRSAVSRLSELKRAAAAARPRILGSFSPEAVLPAWVDMYRHLLGLPGGSAVGL